MVICLERGADLHMAQLMPLPLTVSCFSKIQTGFTFLVPAHPVVPEKGPLNGCVCVCAVYCVITETGVVSVKITPLSGLVLLTSSMRLWRSRLRSVRRAERGAAGAPPSSVPE